MIDVHPGDTVHFCDLVHNKWIEFGTVQAEGFLTP